MRTSLFGAIEVKIKSSVDNTKKKKLYFNVIDDSSKNKSAQYAGQVVHN
jgi:hypothetical protein